MLSILALGAMPKQQQQQCKRPMSMSGKGSFGGESCVNDDRREDVVELKPCLSFAWFGLSLDLLSSSLKHVSRICRLHWSKNTAIKKLWGKASPPHHLLPASVVTAPSVNVFKKRLEEFWTEIFPHLPHWLNTHPSFSLPPPPPTFPPAHHPLTVIMSIHNPTPCFTYVVSSGPLWPTFYHYKS